MGVRLAQMNDTALPRLCSAVGPGPWLRLGGLLRDRPRLPAAVLSAGAVASALERARAGISTLCDRRVAREAASNFAARLAILARHGTFVGAGEAVERLVLQCGTVVVASPHTGAARELVATEGVGLVLPLDRDAWIRATLALLADAVLFAGPVGRRRLEPARRGACRPTEAATAI